MVILVAIIGWSKKFIGIFQTTALLWGRPGVTSTTGGVSRAVPVSAPHHWSRSAPAPGAERRMIRARAKQGGFGPSILIRFEPGLPDFECAATIDRKISNHYLRTL